MTEADDQQTVIPIIKEVASVSTREVETGHLRVRTEVEERTDDILVHLARQDITIERRAVEREVDTAPAPYEEGDLLIIPIVEERAVVQKRLFVVEEVVVRRVAYTEERHLPTMLRSMRAVVEGNEQVREYP